MGPNPSRESLSAFGAGPILTPALVALRDGFNIAFPLRDKTSDGWIGDAAHQATVSGHNPDDTAGVRAEYSDADTIAEVRAIDVDADLRVASWPMQAVIDRILVTPRDLRRLRYIIYNRTVWSADLGWIARSYNGLDPHVSHAHFSGNPMYDNDASAWSVETLGDNVYTESQMRAFPWQYDGRGIGENNGDTVKRSMLDYMDEILETVRDTNKRVRALEARPDAGLVEHTHETGPALPTTAPEV